MATLTELEQQILDELGENSSSPEVRAGSTDLREALADAIDEVCMTGAFFTQEVLIPLVADVAFYQVVVEGGSPLWAKKARIIVRDSRLEAESLLGIVAMDENFLISRGTPIRYCQLASDLVMFYPFGDVTGDAVLLDMVCAPTHYGQYNEYVPPRESLEQSLLHYGRYYKLIQVKGSFDDAMYEFGSYLKSIGEIGRFKEHTDALRKLRFSEGNRETRSYGEKD